MSAALERENPNDPTTWKMAKTDLNSLESRILAGLRNKGYPATSVEMDATKLKGGYICDTMRVFIGYGTETTSAKAEAVSRKNEAGGVVLPKSVASRPSSAILKIASPLSNDHDVAMKLRLYEREWHFYETLADRVPVRVPQHLASVKDEATGLITEGALPRQGCGARHRTRAKRVAPFEEGSDRTCSSMHAAVAAQACCWRTLRCPARSSARRWTIRVC